jgi:hypothetical protein
LATVFDQLVRQRATFGNKLTHQRLGALHGLTGRDKAHFIPLEDEDDIISRLQSEGFPVPGRNDNSAPLAKMCLDWSHKSPFKQYDKIMVACHDLTNKPGLLHPPI